MADDLAYMDRPDTQNVVTTPPNSATLRQPERRRSDGHAVQATERIGVSDGIRTRDVQIHSLALYQAELRSPCEDVNKTP